MEVVVGVWVARVVLEAVVLQLKLFPRWDTQQAFYEYKTYNPPPPFIPQFCHVPIYAPRLIRAFSVLPLTVCLPALFHRWHVYRAVRL